MFRGTWSGVTIGDKIEILRAFVSKAGCDHSQRRAEVPLYQLKPFLTEWQQKHMSTAWCHHGIGLGRGELDFVEREILKEWEGIAD